MEETAVRKRATVTAARSAGASTGVRTVGGVYSSAPTTDPSDDTWGMGPSRSPTARMSVVPNGTGAKALVSAGGGLSSLLTSPSVEPGDDEGNGVDMGIGKGLGAVTGL